MRNSSITTLQQPLHSKAEELQSSLNLSFVLYTHSSVCGSLPAHTLSLSLYTAQLQQLPARQKITTHKNNKKKDAGGVHANACTTDSTSACDQGSTTNDALDVCEASAKLHNSPKFSLSHTDTTNMKTNEACFVSLH